MNGRICSTSFQENGDASVAPISILTDGMEGLRSLIVFGHAWHEQLIKHNGNGWKTMVANIEPPSWGRFRSIQWAQRTGNGHSFFKLIFPNRWMGFRNLDGIGSNGQTGQDTGNVGHFVCGARYIAVASKWIIDSKRGWDRLFHRNKSNRFRLICIQNARCGMCERGYGRRPLLICVCERDWVCIQQTGLHTIAMWCFIGGTKLTTSSLLSLPL